MLACALCFVAGAQAAGGTLSAWGMNGEGQAGTGEFSSTGCNCVPVPGTVAGLDGVTELAVGENHVLAFREDGSVWAWGRNEIGQPGHG
jgi:alpha-tubulin suppressor-like RCC1 family protein